MTDEHYEKTDLPFYREEIAPLLPPRLLDFHVHVWRREQWREKPWETDAAGGKYMVVQEQYPPDDLAADLQRLFPDRPCEAVCFGFPSPAVDLGRTNADTALLSATPGRYPLVIAGRGLLPAEELRRQVLEGGFFGYKVFLNWYGDDYGNITIPDMIGPEEMALADELRLVVLLHVPGARRLADPAVQAGVREYAQRYPGAHLVLAHCGRCYLPSEMQQALGAVADLDNVYLDTAMVMDPTVLQIALEGVGPGRLLYATDLPIAAMRGRRVYVMDHWVDLVLAGYPPSGPYRVPAEGIRATFMVYEIILALARAAERVGLSAGERDALFYENGRALLTAPRRGGCCGF
jgi:hypothetical protein